MQLKPLTRYFLLVAILAIISLGQQALYADGPTSAKNQIKANTKKSIKTPLKPQAVKKTKRRPSLKAHVHDHALMRIVTSGNTFHASIEVPSHNIFGFEYAPKNAAQKKIIADKKQWLQQKAADFVKFTGDLCKPTKTVVKSSIDSQVENARKTHSDVNIKVHYSCKRSVEDETIKVEALKYLDIKQLRLSILNDKFLPSKTITEKSYETEI